MTKYDDWKAVYRDSTDEGLPWELGRPRDVLVELIAGGKVKKGRVLDLCCGAGSNTVYLAEKGFDVVGLDIAPGAILRTRAKAGRKRLNKSLNLVTGNFVELPFADSIFDLAFDLGCFHHVKPEDRDAFINGVHRVLKPGALYQMTCFSYRGGPAWNHFKQEDIRNFFSGSFEIKDVKHYGSMEKDGVRRYFYTFLMERI